MSSSEKFERTAKMLNMTVEELNTLGDQPASGDKKKKKESNPFYYSETAAKIIVWCEQEGTPLIYVGESWYKYCGTHYKLIGDGKVDDLINNFLKANGAPVVAAITKNIRFALKTDCSVSASDDSDAMPFYSGSDGGDFFSNPREGMTFKNGLYNARLNQFRAHTKKWVTTSCLRFNYDIEAVCPIWMAFLNSVFDDQQEIELLQEWIGYCLTHDNSFQKFLLMLGVPRAGKGTITRVLQMLIGKDGFTGYSFHQLNVTVHKHHWL